MAYFLPIASSIKRLKLSRDIPDEFDHEMGLISRFNNAEEFHIVCLDGFIEWGHEVDAVHWPCKKENLVFSEQAPWIEYGDGRPIGYLELRRWFRKYYSEIDPEQYNAEYWDQCGYE